MESALNWLGGSQFQGHIYVGMNWWRPKEKKEKERWITKTRKNVKKKPGEIKEVRIQRQELKFKVTRYWVMVAVINLRAGDTIVLVKLGNVALAAGEIAVAIAAYSGEVVILSQAAKSRSERDSRVCKQTGCS